MQRFRIRQFVQGPAACHFCVSDLRDSGHLHTHDFPELFWVRSGSGVHRLNGHESPLLPGMLIFVRPDDLHALAAPAGQTMTIANLAFAASRWKALQKRYFPQDPDPFDRPDRVLRLGAVLSARLEQEAEELLAGGRGPRVLDRFLLNVRYLVSEADKQTLGDDTPEWLRWAVGEMAQPCQLQKGVLALVELAGRSPEHVARTVRKHFGKTPTNLVNELRLAWAAQQLAQTRLPIAEVADQCGWANTSHFYRLFQARFGKTPAAYRHAAQLIVGG